MTAINNYETFKYSDKRFFSDGVIDVKVVYLHNSKEGMGNYPMYGCFIYLSGTKTRIGEISLRIGSEKDELYYDSHIGYGIDEPYRGNGYAGRACILIRELAIYHGIDKLYFTCNINNNASTRVLEKLGATLLETIDVPAEYCDEYDVIPKRYRYMWDIKKNEI